MEYVVMFLVGVLLLVAAIYAVLEGRIVYDNVRTRRHSFWLFLLAAFLTLAGMTVVGCVITDLANAGLAAVGR